MGKNHVYVCLMHVFQMLLLHHCFISVLSPGCDPKIMGIGPVPASEAALAAAGKTVADMDVVEVSGCLYHAG